MSRTVYGVPGRHPSGEDGKKPLPKAKIKLVLKHEEKLKLQHDRVFSEMKKWDDFKESFKSENTVEDALEIDKFVLESVQRANRARSQIVETNERPILFVYGDQAEVYNFSLRLIEGGKNFRGQKTDWLTQFEKFYNRFRAQTIADYQLDLSIRYKEKEFHGVWLNMDIQEESDFDRTAVVNFQLFVLKKVDHTYTINGEEG